MQRVKQKVVTIVFPLYYLRISVVLPMKYIEFIAYLRFQRIQHNIRCEESGNSLELSQVLRLYKNSGQTATLIIAPPLHPSISQIRHL